MKSLLFLIFVTLGMILASVTFWLGGVLLMTTGLILGMVLFGSAVMMISTAQNFHQSLGQPDTGIAATA